MAHKVGDVVLRFAVVKPMQARQLERERHLMSVSNSWHEVHHAPLHGQYSREVLSTSRWLGANCGSAPQLVTDGHPAHTNIQQIMRLTPRPARRDPRAQGAAAGIAPRGGIMAARIAAMNRD